MTIDRYAHLVGGARMAARAAGRRRRLRPPRLRRPEPLRRRRQHLAHPGRSQPGADHHGAGRPRRGPPHRPGPARPDRAPDAAHHDAHRPADHGRHTAVYTLSRPPNPKPTARCTGTPRPRSPSTLTPAGRPGWAGPTAAPPPRPSSTDHLADAVRDRDAFDIAAGWEAMHRACRNLGSQRPGHAGLSAVDIAWWDLKARLLDVPLTDAAGLLPHRRPDLRLRRIHHLHRRPARRTGRLVAVGRLHRHENQDRRVLGHPTPMRDLGPGRRTARTTPATASQLMVDANGGYTIGQARRVGAALDDLGVVWFEEPVSSDDTAGLATCATALRCDIAAGEYAADCYDIRALLPVVDCLQLDATRCGGYTGWLARRRPRRRAQPAGLGPLRPRPARLRRRSRAQPAPRRMVRRPRPARTAPRSRAARGARTGRCIPTPTPAGTA